jgi:hypothetical protein
LSEVQSIGRDPCADTTNSHAMPANTVPTALLYYTGGALSAYLIPYKRAPYLTPSTMKWRRCSPRSRTLALTMGTRTPEHGTWNSEMSICLLAYVAIILPATPQPKQPPPLPIPPSPPLLRTAPSNTLSNHSPVPSITAPVSWPDGTQLVENTGPFSQLSTRPAPMQ